MEQLKDFKRFRQDKRGEDHHMTTLTERQVRIIRASMLTSRVLAIHFGVAQQTISRIKRRETWGHVV